MADNKTHSYTSDFTTAKTAADIHAHNHGLETQFNPSVVKNIPAYSQINSVSCKVSATKNPTGSLSIGKLYAYFSNDNGDMLYELGGKGSLSYKNEESINFSILDYVKNKNAKSGCIEYSGANAIQARMTFTALYDQGFTSKVAITWNYNEPRAIVTVTKSGEGTVSGAGTYHWGNSYTIKATPATGYKFVKWSDGNTNASRTFTVDSSLITAYETSKSYQAVFEKQTYTLTVTAGTGGTVSGGGTYSHGATATLKATPNTGYKFVKWSDGNTSATRTVTVSGAATYTATFEKLTYTVTWKNADGTTLETDTGVAYGTTPTYNGSTPTKAYDSTYHYTFKDWDKTVGAITGNTTYTATYNSVAHSYTSKVTKAATCTSAGERTYTCSCGRSYTESIPALGHSYTDVVTQPTETANGYTTHTCKNDSSHSYVDTYTCLATFKNYDGSVLKTEKVNQGGTPTAPTNPTRTGYKFIGWSPAVGAINNSTVFTAVYEKLPPQITTVTITRSSDLANVSISAPVDAGAKFIISVEVT